MMYKKQKHAALRKFFSEPAVHWQHIYPENTDEEVKYNLAFRVNIQVITDFMLEITNLQ